ncbi:hypothetical protein [Romboutsia timonensis]|uniref:hypothetical protein n=1 Tax=Romboutsia timonensis TaxID=1776391 RepID=UPI0008D9CF66|nr:hypothetical protein [Romboutsia timonensis]
MKILEKIQTKVNDYNQDLYSLPISIGNYELLIIIDGKFTTFKNLSTRKELCISIMKNGEVADIEELKTFKRFEELEEKYMFNTWNVIQRDLINDLIEYLENKDFEEKCNQLNKELEECIKEIILANEICTPPSRIGKVEDIKRMLVCTTCNRNETAYTDIDYFNCSDEFLKCPYCGEVMKLMK